MTAAVPPRSDGRNLRSANTRRTVAEAYLDLAQDGVLRPTARAVAGRAKVSERAVFRHFRDLESLMAEAARLQIERVGKTVPPPAPSEGPFPARLEAFVARWTELNEKVTPVRRAALLFEPFSEEVARRLGWIRGVHRNEVERAFEIELSALSGAGRGELIAAVSAVSSWPAWNELRARHDLDVAAARRMVTRTITALLQHPETP